MKRDLQIFELYDTSNKKKIDEFNANVNSNYTIETNYEKNDVDFEWLTIIEETVRYLDNILRSPNRFIVNEEEVVQIEKARKKTPLNMGKVTAIIFIVEKIKFINQWYFFSRLLTNSKLNSVT